MAKKHLVVEWLSWLPYKSGFINSNILETSKDRPDTPPSLKLLDQRLWGAKSLDQEGLTALKQQMTDYVLR